MRPLDTATSTAIAGAVTAPHHLVEMGFDTPVRLSTCESVVWGGSTYTQAEITIGAGDQPSVTIFNEVLSLGVTVLTDGTAGRPIKIWQMYRSSSSGDIAGFTQPVLMFDGEMGGAAIGEQIAISTRRWRPLYTPRRYVAPPLFNHCPKAGTVIEMPGQKITLE